MADRNAIPATCINPILIIILFFTIIGIVSCTPPLPPSDRGGGSKVEVPTFSPVSGTVLEPTAQVTISTKTKGAYIHYTTDGSTPTVASPLYKDPITLTATKEDGSVTVKAIAVKDKKNSDVASATYTIKVAKDTTKPGVSLSSTKTRWNTPALIIVTFTEAVTGFTADQITVTTANATVSGLDSSKNPVFTFTLTPVDLTAVSDITVTVAADACTDVSGNGNTASDPLTVTYDPSAPTAVISSNVANPTNANPIPVTITFNKQVNDFTMDDLVVENGTASNFISTSKTVFTVTISPAIPEGTITVSVPENKCVDEAGNSNVAATPLAVSFDGAKPAVVLSSTSPNATSDNPIPVTIAFSEPVTVFTIGGITVTNGSAGNFVIADNKTFTVDITPNADNLTVTVNVNADVCHDQAGNNNTAATTLSRVYSLAPTVVISSTSDNPTNVKPIPVIITFSEPVPGFTINGITVPNGSASNFTPNDNNTVFSVNINPAGDGAVTVTVYAGACTDTVGIPNKISNTLSITYDGSAPTVTINHAAGQADPTNNAAINFTVVFSEPLTGFASDDVLLSGSAGATTALVTGSGTTYNVAVSGMSRDGTVIATVRPGAVVDPIGNPSDASTSTDNQVSYDGTPPTVTITKPSTQAEYTNGSPIYFAVAFSEPMTGFEGSDIQLSGNTGAQVSSLIPQSELTYLVAVSNMTVDGTVTATIPAAAASDSAGNGNIASPMGGNSVVYDRTPPSVTINQAANQIDPTENPTILFTAVFSEPVTGFTETGVLLSGSAGATNVSVSGSGSTYTVSVSGMTGYSTTVIADINAGCAIDAAGNANLASTSIDNSVTYDIVKPNVTSITLTTNPSTNNPTTGAYPIPVTIAFSEAINPVTFTESDISVSGAGAVVQAGSLSSSDNITWHCNLLPTAAGDINVTINADVCADLAGNTNNGAGSPLTIHYISTVGYNGYSQWESHQAVSNTGGSSFTVGNNPNRIALVLITAERTLAPAVDITSVSLDGYSCALVPGTKITYVSPDGSYSFVSAIYYYVNPAVKLMSPSIVLNSTANLDMGLVVLYNVDQNSPFGAVATNTLGGATGITTGVNSIYQNSMLIDLVSGSDPSDDKTWGAGEAPRWYRYVYAGMTQSCSTKQLTAPGYASMSLSGMHSQSLLSQIVLEMKIVQ